MKVSVHPVNPHKASTVVSILGIDCGFSAPGLAVVEFDAFPDLSRSRVIDVGCIITESRKDGRIYKAWDDARRIREVVDLLLRFVDRHKLNMVVMELPISGARDANAIKGMAFSLAMFVAAVHTMEITTTYVTPHQNKLATTGHKFGDKSLIIKRVQEIWPGIPWITKIKRGKPTNEVDPRRQEAVADALSTVVCYVNQVLSGKQSVLLQYERTETGPSGGLQD